MEVNFALVAGRSDDWSRGPSIIQLYGPRTGETATGSALTEGAKAATESPAVQELATTGAIRNAIARRFQALIDASRDERFEDGMDSNLSVGMRVLFRNHGQDFAHVLEEQLKKDRMLSQRVLVAILHALGSIEDSATKDWRFATLVSFLHAKAPNVRDAAAVGLAYLDDRRAIPYIEQAIERETSKTFQEDLRAVVEQLASA